MWPLELTATASTSPKFWSGEIFRKSVEASKGICGTAARAGVWATTRVRPRASAQAPMRNGFTATSLLLDFEDVDARRRTRNFVGVHGPARHPGGARIPVVDGNDDRVMRVSMRRGGRRVGELPHGHALVV